jgi:hypothetical protein
LKNISAGLHLFLRQSFWKVLYNYFTSKRLASQSAIQNIHSEHPEAGGQL